MRDRRTYGQLCGVAKALDVLGGRWTLLIVRDLLLGPRRFVDLQRGLPGIAPNLLSARLKLLAEAEVVEQFPLPPPAGGRAYRLTAVGQGLEPVILGLGRFGQRWLTGAPEEDQRDLRWLMLSLRRRYRGGVRDGVVALVSPERAFTLTLAEDALTTSDGEPERPDVRIVGPEPELMAALLGRPAKVQLSGDVERWIALLDSLRAPA